MEELHAGDRENFWFAFEGAEHPDGPWWALRVVEGHGFEEVSAHFEIVLELVRTREAHPVEADALVGRPCSLRIRTGTTPPYRLIHGVIAEATDLADEAGARVRVAVRPPLHRASLMQRSAVFVDKTLRQIVDLTLQHGGRSGLAPFTGPDGDDQDGGDGSTYTPPRVAYAWRCVGSPRLDDARARPFCVQYEESDLDFVGRLLEEEGISTHWVHAPDRALLVLSDNDRARRSLRGKLARAIPGREVADLRPTGAMRPESVALRGYNWRNPRLLVHGHGGAEGREFHTARWAGRLEESPEHAALVAQVRRERHEAERRTVRGEARTRLLGAGTVFEDEDDRRTYLVTRLEWEIRNYGSFGRASTDPIFVAQFTAVRADATGESRFRPGEHTPAPRIFGVQTAVVTSEPGAREAEINVGGPEDVGCVRVRFHWDTDDRRNRDEPSSCWIRVSQLFAGNGHGAVFNPRVGEEVLVAFLDGDPDRPVIVGRVYNGANRPAIGPEDHPTQSYWRTYSSPNDGNYSQLLFDDAQGAEKVELLSARDLRQVTKRDAVEEVGGDARYTVNGSLREDVGGEQKVHVGGELWTETLGNVRLRTAGHEQHDVAGQFQVEASRVVLAAKEITHVQSHKDLRVNGGTGVSLDSLETVSVAAGRNLEVVTGRRVNFRSTVFAVRGDRLSLHADATLHLRSGGPVHIDGSVVLVNTDPRSISVADFDPRGPLAWEAPDTVGPAHARLYGRDRRTRAAGEAREEDHEEPEELETTDGWRERAGPEPPDDAPRDGAPPDAPDDAAAGAHEAGHAEETRHEQPDGSHVRRSRDGLRFERELPDGTRLALDLRRMRARLETPSGVELELSPDGSRRLAFPGGVTVEQRPDGSFRQSLPGGLALEVEPDGTMAVDLPNGQTITREPDGTIHVAPTEREEGEEPEEEEGTEPRSGEAGASEGHHGEGGDA